MHIAESDDAITWAAKATLDLTLTGANTEGTPSAAAFCSAAFRSTQYERAYGGVFLKRLDVGKAATKHGLQLGGCAVPQL